MLTQGPPRLCADSPGQENLHVQQVPQVPEEDRRAKGKHRPNWSAMRRQAVLQARLPGSPAARGGAAQLCGRVRTRSPTLGLSEAGG